MRDKPIPEYNNLLRDQGLHPAGRATPATPRPAVATPAAVGYGAPTVATAWLTAYVLGMLCGFGFGIIVGMLI